MKKYLLLYIIYDNTINEIKIKEARNEDKHTTKLRENELKGKDDDQ